MRLSIDFRKDAALDSLELARLIAELLEDKKAEDILVLDLRPDRVIADFFVIATGTSDRNLKALAQHVRVELKDKHGIMPASMEGIAESGWVLLDYGEVVVHIFLEDKRQYYDLEGLWRAESKVILSIK
ncbi:MAG: ribosome silencing factor [Chloroflexi bacterium]|jgi:ribosome-associated protein|nr:MAG: iojap family protein [Chloroflexi bacterium OLB13]MBC6955452.1 ribosome silencing factor [Chloroflexota bacterium]MBV6436669.1 Ribosomal silencing factor RsfS [Anaerolineae bacterium]MDL1915914.1 ribosome silencing factor [Anaerolineae bacterium CFX4]OQY79560.1 MAG: ribosome silencing factor [Anaerolineae bacterium UTCFX5]